MSECNTPDLSSNKFKSSTNTYYNVGTSNSLNEATQLDAGLMSASDYCKLNSIVIPPPFITLTANKCNTIIKGGIIGIISGDSYIKVDSTVNIKQNEDGISPTEYENIPLKIHGNTYGIRFSLDIDRLSAYLIKNHRLILKGTTGVQGDVGDVGINGSDYILSGPKGDDGLPGSTPLTNYVIQNESIDVVQTGSTAITDIQPIINTDGTYDLIITRQPIGNTEISTNRVSVDGVETNWAVVIQGPGTSRDLYYLDLGPIHNSIFARAIQYSELIRKGYEDAVKFWIKTMSDLFDSQKSALCCALEKCKSRIKNDSLRRHFELTSATAKPDYQTVIKTRRDNPSFIAGTGVLKELYPSGDFCQDPEPICNMSDGEVTLISTNVDCLPNVNVQGNLKFDAFGKDVKNPISLSVDYGTITPTSTTKENLLNGISITYSCIAKNITVKPSGQCLNSIQLPLPNIPEPQDPLCTFGVGTLTVKPLSDVPNFEIVQWVFSERNYDLNFKDITLDYDENHIKQNPMWKLINGRYGLRADFSDSLNCGGDNPFVQYGTAQATIKVTVPESIVIEWSGIGELQDPNFEKMLLYIDNDLIGQAQAKGGGLKCQMGPIVSQHFYPDGYPLTVGNHEVKIEVTTNDGLYHVSSYYQFVFKPAGSSGQCKPGVKNTGILKYASLDPDLLTFTLTANVGSVSPNSVTRKQLLDGIEITFNCEAKFIEVKSTGECTTSDIVKINDTPTPSSVSGIVPFSVDENELLLTLNVNNIGYPLNAATIKLPKGKYKLKIIEANSYINDQFSIPLRIMSTRGMAYKSIDFPSKGVFSTAVDLNNNYINDSIIVDHDGGLLKAYFVGTKSDQNNGGVIIGISPLKIRL